MMKKLLALLLSVVMAVSLAAPAFAASDLGGDAIPISAPGDDIPDGGFDWGTAEKEDLDAHPGLEEQLRASAYDYFAREYPYYESAQEYMETWELTEEEFLDLMVMMQAGELVQEEQQRQYLDSLKEAMGGVPGQIGVMVNGQYIQFPDAVPEITNGRTMTPVRALMETLGGEAEMVDDKVICEANGVRLTFTPGSNEVLVEYPGGELPSDGQIFPMDCAPYIKGGRTYVPVRFIGEALGYEVGWDGQFETAVLVNRAALAAQIDEKFTILNRVQASRAPAMEEGENYRADLKGSMTVTVFDTLHGDKTCQAELAGKTLMNTGAVDGVYSITVPDDTIDTLLEYLSANLAYTDMTGEEKDALRGAINGLKEFEFIMNREGLMWVHAPILDELAGKDDVWCGLDMGAELAETMFGETETATVGMALAAMVDVDSVISYSTTAGNLAQMLYELCGDDCFTTSDGVSTLTIGLEELEALYPYGDMDELKEFALTMEVDQDGGVVMSMTMETAAQYGTPAMRMTMDCTQNSKGVSLAMEFHVANVAKVNLTLTATQQTTNEAPRTEPPEGATVVDAANPLEP